MIFKEITITKLNDYINSREYKSADVIPITMQRVLSHVNNPRCEKNDVSLIIAFDEGEIVGYIGFLPDKMFGREEIKVTWNSCWWTDPVKGKNVAMPLFYKAMKVWDERLLFAELTPLTKEIIKNTGFFNFPLSQSGIRGYLRSVLAEVLPGRKKFYKRIYSLLKLADLILNLICDVKILFWKSRLPFLEYRIDRISRIDEETDHFIQAHNKKELTRRESKELNWILKYPWIIEGNKSDFPESKKYFFSSVAGKFRNYCLKVYSNDIMVGFVFLVQREGIFKIPYCYFEEKYNSLILRVIYKILIDNNAMFFTTFLPDLKNAIIANRSPFFYKRVIHKNVAISKKLEKYYPVLFNVQDGDGDSVFT